MINKVILVGRITKDPELRFVNGDIPLVRFSLAVDRNFSNSSGEKETDFIRCVVWRKQAENLVKYISKGALLGIEGSIRINSFENEHNQKQSITEITCSLVRFLESKKNIIKDDNRDFHNNDNKKNYDFQSQNKEQIQNRDIEKEMDLEEDISIEEEDGMPF
ncbi:single-stranded DNA-binding family protein [Candidatus Phytoplasma oryzae]|uniref:Single-stranded DNA-binding protein n=1 Tax=Candidatus Phytoplasma oryzae TaxID=203274 RepID=A0A139JR02_9MOLU|nr:single-stranded DNA-binding protein [Candidatus Phytoplasma oryzae]KXT29411.1 single-stranded DNA-binding family protein [Candidatus Phytoplasma oryzae]RAM57994.1 single-stranded DNA-binding protein [Candidatus Phytoplasma oryzae]